MKRRVAFVGLGLLALLWGTSFVFGRLAPGVLAAHCPFGRDVLRPDQTVCELSFGGLWVSLGIGLSAGAIATILGLVIAASARGAGGGAERWILRFADSFFALPDVLVLMVIQLAGQLLGDVDPALKASPPVLMVISLALVGWAGPTRMFRNRLASLEAQEFIAAARALGSSRGHLLRRHLWPGLRGFALTVFLSRVPAAILAESTVSFFGIARMEPMSLGRYLGTSYSALIYEDGGRIVLPAWGLLIAVVLASTLASRGLSVPERAR
ncbi:MAG: ABC transporter permease subunit [Myxococcaceae bacterium]|nr:ABC transporter permease subunit [Myxococcaceae bacterium]